MAFTSSFVWRAASAAGLVTALCASGCTHEIPDGPQGATRDDLTEPVSGVVFGAPEEVRAATGIVSYHLQEEGGYSRLDAFDAEGRVVMTLKKQEEGATTHGIIEIGAKTIDLTFAADEAGDLAVSGRIGDQEISSLIPLSEERARDAASRRPAAPALSADELALLRDGLPATEGSSTESAYTWSCWQCHLAALALSAGVTECIVLPNLGCLSLPLALAEYDNNCRNPDPCYTCSTPPFCF
ncbi:hypothetical protein [Sorangium sp. So ce1389]|uniref:hypothetical protein n=1 Tax=Sorangium sp. So ce1389 TaxID=3133336 RepID=UPI003F647910